MISLNDAIESAAVARPGELDSYAERILEAAKQLLIEHGMRRTSMADIAKAAGVSERTVYNRFSDRQALLTAIMIREGWAVKSVQDERLAKVDDPAERLVLSYVTFTQKLRGNELLRRLMVTDPETVLPMLTTNAGPVIAFTREWIEGYAKQAPLIADPVAISEILARLCHSILLTPETILSMHDDQHTEAFARAVLVPMLFGPERSR